MANMLLIPNGKKNKTATQPPAVVQKAPKMRRVSLDFFMVVFFAAAAASIAHIQHISNT